MARRDCRERFSDGRTDCAGSRSVSGRSSTRHCRWAVSASACSSKGSRRSWIRSRRCSGRSVNQKEIATLPLALRNWDDMLFLVPGVQGYRYTEESGGTSAGRTGGISVHGHRSLQNNFLLDGVDNNSISTNVQELSTQLSRPSIDAIGEFKVVTTPFTAEYGRAPWRHDLGNHQVRQQYAARNGAITTSATSGSTPTRSSRIDRLCRSRRTTRISSAAASAAAARRARAFFFADYEGTRITRGVLRTGTVPDRRSATTASSRRRFAIR